MEKAILRRLPWDSWRPFFPLDEASGVPAAKVDCLEVRKHGQFQPHEEFTATEPTMDAAGFQRAIMHI